MNKTQVDVLPAPLGYKRVCVSTWGITVQSTNLTGIFQLYAYTGYIGLFVNIFLKLFNLHLVAKMTPGVLFTH